MALAITPRGDFGDLPNFGKASKRGTRPWLGPVPIAVLHFWQPEAASFNKPTKKIKFFIRKQHHYKK